MKQLFVILLISISTSSFSQDYAVMGQSHPVLACSETLTLIGRDSIFLKSFTFSDIEPSIISDHHTSEGFILNLSDGSLINIFRLDPGLDGHHVGNNAMLVKRKSYDNGATWSHTDVIYNDFISDNRNMQGGLIGKDSIIVFFRKFHAPTWTQLGLYYFYSFDGGVTWTEPNFLPTHLHNCAYGTNKIIHVPERGYLLPIYQLYYAELRFSEDGFNWSTIDYVWDYRFTLQYKFSEVSFAYIGNGNIVGLFRNDSWGYGQNYYMVYSQDNGYTWTEPLNTNLAYPYNCPAPLIFYDEDFDDVWVIVTDRRSNLIGQNPLDESIWIYKNKPDEIIGNPGNFTLIERLDRPLPNQFRFYGYPAQAKIDSLTYLIVFTESYLKPNGKEQAHLFQFTFSYEADIFTPDFYVWNTGETTKDILVAESGDYNVIMLDKYGNQHIDSITVFFENIPRYPFDSDTIYGILGELIINAGYQNEYSTFLWSTGDTVNYINPLYEGYYYVTITNRCGKYIIGSVYIMSEATEYVDELSYFEPQIYPNPAIDFILIQNEILSSVLTVNIYNLKGILVYQKNNIVSGNIDISFLKSGTYIIEILAEEEVFRERLIKK